MLNLRLLRTQFFSLEILLVYLFYIVTSLSAGINEWTTIGPPGLWAGSIAIDPHNTDIVYLGSVRSKDGIYKTTDGGIHWQKSNNGLNDLDIQCIVINPHDTDILYAGTIRGGVFKSTDGGKNWRARNKGFHLGFGGRIEVQSLAIDPEEPNMLYAGHSAFGLYRSTNGGESWELLDSTYIFIRDITIDPLNPDIVYAGTDFPPEDFVFLGGVLKSTDRGDSWREMNSGLYDESLLAIHDIAIDNNNPETIYFGATASGGGYNSVYKSTNGGERWVRSNNNMNSIFTRAIAVDPINSNVLYVANEPFLNVPLGGIYKSTDGGESWKSINEGLTTDWMQKIAIDPIRPDILYVGAWHGGIFKTLNGGGTWIDLTDSTMNANLVRRIAIDPQNPSIIYACVSKGFYKTTDRGFTWSRLRGGLPQFFYPRALAIDFHNTQRLYLGTYTQGLFISENRGGSWERSNEGLESCTPINTVVISPHSTEEIYLGTWEGIYRSDDSGQTWNRPPDALIDQYVKDIIIHPENPDILYVATYEAILKSTDRGQSWVQTMRGLFGLSYHITMDPQDPEVLYVNNSNYSNDGGVFKSTDGGKNWVVKNKGIKNLHPYLEARHVVVLTIDPKDTDILYCADAGNGLEYTGIYMSTDGAENWTSIETELMVDTPVWDMKVDPENHYTIFAATSGASVTTYTRIETEVITSSLSPFVPQEFALYQNYPNPFNPTTTIHFTIPSREQRGESGERRAGSKEQRAESEECDLPTTLKIYNLLGQEVRTLVDETTEAGYYTVTWDGRDSFGNGVASGVYFYRLTAGEFSQTRKMVVMR